MRKRSDRWWSVIPEISQPTVQWETLQASFPTGMVCPRVGIFLSLPKTNDGFYLSHIPVPAHGKDKKQTAACWPLASRTPIRDVILMLI